VDAKEDQQQEKARRHSVPWHKRKFSFKKLRVSQVKPPNKELLEIETTPEAPPPTPESPRAEEAVEAFEEEEDVPDAPPTDPNPEQDSPPVAPVRTKRKSAMQRPQTLNLEGDVVAPSRKASLPAPSNIKLVDLRREEEEGGWDRVMKKLSKLTVAKAN
jgi:hypothetical protein